MAHYRMLPWIAFVAVIAFSQRASGQGPQDGSIAARLAALEQRVKSQEQELEQLRRIVLSERALREIEGHWNQSSHTKSGIEVQHTDDVIWQLKQSHSYQWILSPEPPMWILGRMDIDASKDPAWITFRHDRFGDGERVVPGIVKVKDGTVIIALREGRNLKPHPTDEYPERPGIFKSTKENGVSVFVLVRPNAR